MAAGHGGQILVSAATAELLGRDSLVDLGEHRLKDLAAPEHVYQLGAGGHPPLRSLAFDGFRSRHDSLLRDSVTDHSGEVVKFLGHGVMAAFPGAAESVAAAVGMRQAFHRWQV